MFHGVFDEKPHMKGVRLVVTDPFHVGGDCAKVIA
jgi:hypothetical protein